MRSLAAVFLLLASDCAVLADDDARKAQVDDIREAVFRHQIEQQKLKVCFLGIAAGKKCVDPSDEFLKRFSDVKASVRKWSAAEFQDGQGMVDKVSREDGVSLILWSIAWESDTEAAVFGMHGRGGFDGFGYSYTLKKGKDGWKVVKAELRGIS